MNTPRTRKRKHARKRQMIIYNTHSDNTEQKEEAETDK